LGSFKNVSEVQSDCSREQKRSKVRGKIGEVGLPLRDRPISHFSYSHFVLNEILHVNAAAASDKNYQ